MIERFEKFSFAISELYYFLHKITRDEMEKYGLNGPHAIYLIVLHRHKEGITSSRLAELSFRNKADVSRAITLFIEKGLAVRKGGRSYRASIVLTEKGVAAAESLRERARIVIGIVGKGLTDEKRGILYESLELIASNMRELCGENFPEETNYDKI